MVNLPTVITDGDWNYPLFIKVYGNWIDIGYYYYPANKYEEKDIKYLKRIKGNISIETGIKWTDYRSDKSYLELISTSFFVIMLAEYLWNNAPRSKSKRKVIWPEGMLNYKKFDDLKEDIQTLVGSTLMDNSTEEYLQEFYDKNLLPNIKI